MKVDSREPKHIVRYFRKRGWNVEHAKFGDAGDIADDDLNVIIERKHGTDLVASVHDGRLISQCSRLFRMCDDKDAVGYVIISGDLIESITAYSEYIRKSINKRKPRGHKIYKKSFKLNISVAQIYKTISLLPWHYDINILWFITEDEALETIHYMMQEVKTNDLFKGVKQRAKRKQRARPKTKRKKKVRTNRNVGITIPANIHSSNAKGKNETDEEKYRRLGLI